MVDPIGAKPVSNGRKVVAVARAAAPQAPTKAAAPPEATPTATVAAQLAATPPVDAARVERIKRAIADGKFPLSPATIADQLIALKYDWMSNDQA